MAGGAAVILGRHGGIGAGGDVIAAPDVKRDWIGGVGDAGGDVGVGDVQRGGEGKVGADLLGNLGEIALGLPVAVQVGVRRQLQEIGIKAQRFLAVDLGDVPKARQSP